MKETNKNLLYVKKYNLFIILTGSNRRRKKA